MKNPDLSELTILVVEDQPGMRKVLANIFRELGIKEVLEASSGKDGLKKCQEGKPDIIFTDSAMQPMDGLEFTRQIRKGEAGVDPYLPVVMVSSYSELDKIMEARDAGVTEYLAKPISVNLVYIRMMAVINNPRVFVRAEKFFGPDRRRRALDYGGRERRGESQKTKSATDYRKEGFR